MEKKYLTVDALTKYLKFKFDSDSNLKQVYLKGEISNFKSHTSGHFYFSLKDDKSKINAIMFRNQNSSLNFKPVDGMNVLVIGRVSVYEQVGSYQIYVDEMIEDGLGSLYMAYEKMKEKLEQEGLFLEKHKKNIPEFPEKVGVITAQTGAAVRDIITTLKRRYPISEVFLFPCLVQGKQAHLDIIEKLKQADDFGLDVIILGRGGGSIEDLWPFNEEELARTIFSSKTPIISGVGHEIDFTISDFVADLRAPTPTAAAEIAVPSIVDLKKQISVMKSRVNDSILKKVNYQKLVLESVKNSYVLKNPMIIYDSKKQYVDSLIEKFNVKINQIISNNRVKLDNLKNCYTFRNPASIYKPSLQNLNGIIEKLELLNPISTLKRGFSFTYVGDELVRNVNNIKKDDIILTRVFNGNIKSKVMEVEVSNGEKI